MKSQTDMILMISAVLLALIVGGVFLFTRREPQAPAAPAPVTVSAPTYPEGSVTYANSLPGGGNRGTGAMGGGGAPGGASPAGAPPGSAGRGRGNPAEMVGVQSVAGGG